MLSDKEQKVYNETRLRNLKRKYSRIKEHSELTDIALKLKKQIDELESAMT
jgi:hypothetical protein